MEKFRNCRWIPEKADLNTYEIKMRGGVFSLGKLKGTSLFILRNKHKASINRLVSVFKIGLALRAIKESGWGGVAQTHLRASERK